MSSWGVWGVALICSIFQPSGLPRWWFPRFSSILECRSGLPSLWFPNPWEGVAQSRMAGRPKRWKSYHATISPTKELQNSAKKKSCLWTRSKSKKQFNLKYCTMKSEHSVTRFTQQNIYNRSVKAITGMDCVMNYECHDRTVEIQPKLLLHEAESIWALLEQSLGVERASHCWWW